MKSVTRLCGEASCGVCLKFLSADIKRRRKIMTKKKEFVMRKFLFVFLTLAACENITAPGDFVPTNMTVASMTVTGQYKTSYAIGEAFNPNGLAVTAHYDNGSSGTIMNYTLSWNGSSLTTGNTAITTEAGTKTVAVTYQGIAATFTIHVRAEGVTLTDITVTGMTSYAKNEPFDPAGLVVTARYSDESTAPVTNYIVSWNGSPLTTGNTAITAEAGDKMVKVTYTYYRDGTHEKERWFTIQVSAEGGTGEETGGESGGEAGGGTGGAIIEIRTASELAKIGFESSYPLDGHYSLQNDITVSEWIPIGTNDYQSRQSVFTGTFTGNNHSITINSFTPESMTVANVGFIGHAYEAEIQNLAITLNNITVNLSVTAFQYVGAIVGQCYNTSFKDITINGNLQVTKNSDGYLYMGGIAGFITTLNSKEVEITSCITEIDLIAESTGDICLGGLIGAAMNPNAKIMIKDNQIKKDLAVTGSNVSVGGIAGVATNYTLLSDFKIEDNVFLGNINAVSSSISIGGAVGQADKIIVRNFDYNKTLTCTGNNGYYGGIAGRFFSSLIEYCSVNANINFGNSNNLSCGGLVGTSAQSSIIDSYLNGDIYSNSANGYLGGLVGSNSGTIDNCYHQGEIYLSSGTIGGITGPNSGIIKNSYHQGDFISTDHNKPDVGGISGGNNSGEILNSYCSGNINLASGSIGGISTGNGGLIKNSYHIGTIDISNNNGPVDAGGITSNNSGIISQSYHIGDINITTKYVAGDYPLSMIGGITGYNLSGTIESSYSLAAIHAVATGVFNNLAVGGVAGSFLNQSGKSIINCHHQGILEAKSSGNSSVGEVIGLGYDAIVKNCSHNESDPWNIETFTNLGWDFINVWKVDNQNLLPIFIWQD
jgi:hypothetical protein